MKPLRSIACILVLFLSILSSFAIEGIQLSLQSSNVVLSWPSTNTETYIAQYRGTLLTTDSWVTLTNYLPGADDTNVTFFIHSNIVRAPVAPSGGGGGSGGGMTPPTGGGTNYGSFTNLGYVPTGFYRVVRDGVHLWGITNGMVISNVLVTVLEYAVDSTDEVVGVSFYDQNNAPLTGASGQSIGGNRWLLVWNTTMSFNGDYDIYAKLNFSSDSSVVSPPVTVTVNNLISFPNYFSQDFGDQMWIYAQTIPNAAYTLDIYDENTNYLGTFSDYSDSGGNISFLWDLTDGGTTTFDSTNFFGVFTVDTSSLSSHLHLSSAISNLSNPTSLSSAPVKKTFSGKVSRTNGPRPKVGGSTASAKQFWVKEGRWTPNNNWVVAYSPLTDPAADPNTSTKELLMMLGGEGGEFGGPIQTLDAYGLSGSLSPGNRSQSTAFELADTNSRAQLLSYLSSRSPQYENFYYFGHGNAASISAYNSKATGITASQISLALGNVPLSFEGPDGVINVDSPIIIPTRIKPEIRRVARHPYRLVFLDGCETASGNFCESFGIPAFTVSTNFFAAAGVESRAFLGYKNEISFNTSQWDWRALMIGGFLADWQTLNDLQSCVSNAKNGTHSSGIQPMSSSAVIYGAYDLRYDTKTRP